MKYLEINNIDIGAQEAKKDRLLKETFIKPEGYKLLLNFRKFIVVGRRGTGKSAIFKMLGEEYSNDKYKDKIILIKISDYDKFKLGSEKDIFFRVEELGYTFRWEYFIINQISDNIIGGKYKGKFTETVNCKKAPIIEKISNFFQKLKISLGPDGISAEYNKNNPKEEEEIDLDKVITSIKDIKEALVKDLKKNGMKIVILFDELDTAFEVVGSKEKKGDYTKILYGLIDFAFKLDIDSNIYPILFFRADIFDKIKGPNMAKIHNDILNLDLFWNKDNLKELIKSRIEKATGKKDYYKKVFLEECRFINNIQTLDYVLDSTFYRPRDIISLTNFIIEKLSEIELDNYINQDIETKNENFKEIYKKKINSAIIEFGKYSIDSIKNENSKKYELVYNDPEFINGPIEKLLNLKPNYTFGSQFLKDQFKSYIKKKKRVSFKVIIQELYYLGLIGMEGFKPKNKGFYFVNHKKDILKVPTGSHIISYRVHQLIYLMNKKKP